MTRDMPDPDRLDVQWREPEYIVTRASNQPQWTVTHFVPPGVSPEFFTGRRRSTLRFVAYLAIVAAAFLVGFAARGSL